MSALLLNKDMAFRFVLGVLRERYGCWFNLLGVNKGRHVLLQPQGKDVPVFYCLFKREFMREFNLFARDFLSNPDYESYAGLGESINEEWLGYSIKVADYLLFVYPDRKIYMISPLAVKKFCDKHGLVRVQKRVNEYRLPDGGESRELVRERTYFFPLKLLENLEVM